MEDWTNLPILLAVARTGSLTAASRQLNISQPTISRRIKALENRFGESLLTRERTGYVLTDFGRVIYEHVEKMQSRVDAIERYSISQEEDIAGQVRLSVTEGVMTRWMPAILQILRYNYPNLNIEMDARGNPLNLVQREAEIGIRWQSPGHQNSLIARKVASVSMGLFASEEYLKVNGIPEKVNDLDDFEGVELAGEKNQIKWKRDSQGNLDKMPKRISLKTNSVTAYFEAILRGYGIGALPLCAVWAGKNNLVRVLPELKNQNDLWLVSNSDLLRSRRIRAVYDFLVNSFKIDAGFFEHAEKSKFTNPYVIEMKNPPKKLQAG